MKKSVFGFLTAVLALCLAVSCSQERPVSGEQLVSVKLVTFLPVEKSGVETSYAGGYKDAEVYKYKATPQFADDAKGKTDFTSVTLNESGVAVLEGFSQGYWEFTVQAFNHNMGLMYEGSAKAYLTSSSNTVTVVLSPKYDELPGLDNNVEFNITAPIVGNNPSFVCSLTTAAGTAVSLDSLTLSAVDSKHSLTGSITLNPGTYVLTLANKDGSTVVGGQAIGFKVIGKTKVTVAGNVNNGIYVDASLTVTTKFFSGKVQLKAQTDNVYEFVPDTGSLTPTSRKWYVNGVEAGTSETYTFSADKSGLYCITCVAFCNTTTPNEVTSDSLIFEYTVPPEEE